MPQNNALTTKRGMGEYADLLRRVVAAQFTTITSTANRLQATFESEIKSLNNEEAEKRLLAQYKFSNNMLKMTIKECKQVAINVLSDFTSNMINSQFLPSTQSALIDLTENKFGKLLS